MNLFEEIKTTLSTISKEDLCHFASYVVLQTGSPMHCQFMRECRVAYGHMTAEQSLRGGDIAVHLIQLFPMLKERN